ncbi:MAG TPA: hypothetical protein VFW39_00620 [Sphingomicrobium sp.]|nr:hypothetical protein [Sphingomicrobium sp.]
MNGTGTRHGMSWGARLLIGFVLVVSGAAAATWGLAHYQSAARLVGITPAERPAPPAARPAIANSQPRPPASTPPAQSQAQAQQIADLEQRVARVESATEHAEGSAGRADALVIAFAARRAIDRGVALGYLENLLVDRFGGQHQAAVATIVTASRQPIRLDDLLSEYDSLGPDLRRGGPQESWWDGMKRELGSLVEIHSIDRPAANPDARYRDARQELAGGNVDQALAETMRLPGAARAGDWIAKARRYIAAHRALDEVESAALLPTPNSAG